MITAFGDFVGREELVSSLERMSEEENVPGAVLIEGSKRQREKDSCQKPRRRHTLQIEGKAALRGLFLLQKGRDGSSRYIARKQGRQGRSLGGRHKTAEKRGLRHARREQPKGHDNNGKHGSPAQNALLKTLEEPPAGVTFIITVRRREEMLDTVVSRCMPVLLTPLAVSDVEEFLQRKFSDVKKEGNSPRGRTVGGLYRRGGRTPFLGKNPVVTKRSKKMLQSTARGRRRLLKAVMPFEKDVASFADVIVTAGGVFRDAYMKKRGAAEKFSGYAAEVDALCGAMTSKRLAECYRSCEKTAARLKENPKINLLLTVLCAEL